MKLIVALTTDTIEQLKEVKAEIEEMPDVGWVQVEAEDDEEREMLNKEVIE